VRAQGAAVRRREAQAGGGGGLRVEDDELGVGVQQEDGLAGQEQGGVGEGVAREGQVCFTPEQCSEGGKKGGKKGGKVRRRRGAAARGAAASPFVGQGRPSKRVPIAARLMASSGGGCR
jgi:hypothetical protein